MHLRLKVKFKLKFNLSSCHTFLVIVQFCTLYVVICHSMPSLTTYISTLSWRVKPYDIFMAVG